MECIVSVLSGARMTGTQRVNITYTSVLQSMFLPQKIV